MGAVVSIQIQGLPQLNDRLNKLAIELRTQVLVKSMKKALDQVLTTAIEKAPMGTGEPWAKGEKYKGHPGRLKSSFRIRKINTKIPGLLEVQLQNTAYYALWVEYGHRIVRGGSYKSGKGKVVGWKDERPFMRPTFNEKWEYMLSEVQASIRRRLNNKGV